ncbi:hypothetical protein [Cellulomonas aerilata]|uniref:Uncharacterized protein n=1 Tax=Cellulomonas aerilata TaxID=515326 RepID=A0A512DA72_9CELL|nr:hypothetical protein [Cellulomonas aerilata]GEO33277.1 hypothetical protein CAE01nite_10020 [Cellulomonas aerilata]
MPVYTADEVRAHVRRWTAAAWWLAGGAIALTVAFTAVLADAGEQTDPVGILAIGSAVVGGLLLLGIGIGMLHGEALRAHAVGHDPTGAAGQEPAGDTGTVVQGLPHGLGGLTAARTLVLAGAALLATAAISGGIGLAGADETQDRPATTRTPG